jgi:hypothetical protein
MAVTLGYRAQLRSSCLVIHFADGVDQGRRLVELDVFRAVAGEDLFSVRRQSEPARLGQRALLLIFEVLRRVRRLPLQVADRGFLR